MSVDMVITVIEPFTEARTGRAYAPGDVIDDPFWHDPANRRLEAYAARGKVTVGPVASEPPETPAKKRAGRKSGQGED